MIIGRPNCERSLASVVLATGLFVVGLALYAEFTFVYQNREKAIATLVAQEYIEKLRGLPYQDDPDNNDIAHINSSWAMDAKNKPVASAYLNSFLGAVVVENSYGSDIKKISVAVNWTSLSGRQLQVQLATLLTHNGIDKK